MILTDLRQHLANNRTCNLLELSMCVNAEPEVVRDMLQLMIQKGQVCLRQKTENCGSSCSKCSPLLTEIYEWLG